MNIIISGMKKLIVFFALAVIANSAFAECIDSDGDGYGKTGLDCMFSAPDCDDSNPDRSPGKKEICGNGIDEDCSGKDKSCVQCNQGTIFFRCSCGGNVYETGYCCNNTFQETHCDWCTEEIAEIKECITEDGCSGRMACFNGEYTQCYDVTEDNCPCIEEWKCDGWTEHDCVNGKLLRECNDKNNCGTINFKPGTERNCLAEERKLQAILSAEAVKENETVIVTVLYQNSPVPSATVQYSGKSMQTSGLGKAYLTAVFGQEKIRVSKPGFDAVEVNLKVIKADSVKCGDNYCDSAENEINCPADCKQELNLIVPEEVFEGEEFTVKVTSQNGSGIKGKKVYYGNQLQYTNIAGNAVFTAVKEISSVKLVNGKTITKNFSVREKTKGYCGDKVCSKTENSANCPKDCFDIAGPENSYIIAGAVIVFILFIIALIKVK
jgi:hypothetical protein